MTERSHLPATIRARVHDGAIDRVSRFFNASVADAAAELIQNARRSGATRLDVATETTEGGTVVTVTDDGFGIADPAVLLSFGESGWDAATAKARGPRRHGRLCAVQARLRDFVAAGHRRDRAHARLAGRAHARVLPRQAGGPDRRLRGCPPAQRHRDLLPRGGQPRGNRRRLRRRRAALPARGDGQRRGRRAQGLPRRRRPNRALARPRVRRLQRQVHRLQRPRPQLPRAHALRAPAQRGHHRRRHLVGARRRRRLPRAGAGPARPARGGADALPGRHAQGGPYRHLQGHAPRRPHPGARLCGLRCRPRGPDRHAGRAGRPASLAPRHRGHRRLAGHAQARARPSPAPW